MNRLSVRLRWGQRNTGHASAAIFPLHVGSVVSRSLTPHYRQLRGQYERAIAHCLIVADRCNPLSLRPGDVFNVSAVA